jgi:anti-anti-sigma factor
MPSDAAVPPALVVPPNLNTVTRAEFRQVALDRVDDAVRAAAAAVVIDLHETRSVDASVLGILVVAQRRAGEHAVPVRLVRVPEEVRRLMAVTGLEKRFEFGAGEPDTGTGG